jgi:hypothetical protein
MQRHRFKSFSLCEVGILFLPWLKNPEIWTNTHLRWEHSHSTLLTLPVIQLPPIEPLQWCIPNWQKKYGPVVTYEDKPSAHAKVEFGFDVDQVAEGNYAPKAYHDFIGFEVSEPVLERAFARTYSVEMSNVFVGVDLAIGSYRHAVSTVIPHLLNARWHFASVLTRR